MAKAVSKKKAQDLVVAGMMEDAGMGTEAATKDDMLIPFLSIFQKLSPQVNKRKSEYIDGAEPGLLFNSSTQEIYLGGVTVIPIFFEPRWIEWVPREDGGGFVADHGNNPSVEQNCVADDRGGLKTKDGHDMVKTGTWYVLVVTPQGAQQAIMALSRSQMKHSRRWVSSARGIKLPRPDGQGEFNPPLFGYSYAIEPVEEQNDQGDWFGFGITIGEPTLALSNGGNIYQEAKELCAQFKEGAIKFDMGKSQSAPSEEADAF